MLWQCRSRADLNLANALLCDAPCIMGFPHFSWWEHKPFPDTWESSEVSDLLLSAGSFPSLRWFLLTPGKISPRQRRKGTLCLSLSAASSSPFSASQILTAFTPFTSDLCILDSVRLLGCLGSSPCTAAWTLPLGREMGQLSWVHLVSFPFTRNHSPETPVIQNLKATAS